MSHYDILQVNKNATNEEIKKAFRMMSLKYHPDKNGGNDDKFKEINESYSILSDSNKRKQYDLANSFDTDIFNFLKGNMSNNNMHFSGANTMPFNTGSGGVFNVPFPFPFHFESNAQFQHDIDDELLTHLFENILGNQGMPDIKIFTKSNAKTRSLHKDPPQPIDIVYDVTLEDLYNGKEVTTEYERTINNYHNEKTNVTFTIAKGVSEKNVIIIEGKGHILNNLCGDVHIILNVLPHDTFKKDGNNKPKLWIHMDYHINSRKWKNFMSRNSTDLNQPYLYLTIQSIINHNSNDFHICLIDDDAFEKILPNEIVNRPKFAYQAPEAKVFFNNKIGLKIVNEFIDGLPDNEKLNKDSFMNLISKFKNPDISSRLGFRENMAFIIGLSDHFLKKMSANWSTKNNPNKENINYEYIN